MKKMKNFIVIGLMAFISFPIFAQTKKVQDMVDSKICSELLKNGVVIKIHEEGNNELTLVPATDYADKIKQNRVKKAEKNFPFTYESIYYIKKSDLLKASNSSKTEINIDDISKILRSVSKMQGMKYYSTTKKKNLVLYEKAFMVDGENSNNKIADLNTGNADGLQAYCLQDDNSFGVNHYRLNYFQKENSMLAFFTSTDVMGLGPIKAINPGNLKISIFVEDCGEGVLLYLCTDLDSAKFPGIKAQIEDSMSSRMDAIYKWFLEQF